MAYIGLVDYDEGGRIQSLDGLAEVMYDSGATRNLLGKALSAVKYDDGGRFRTLVGLGDDFTDLPLAPASTDIPISFVPPTPSPVVDTIAAPITGTLVDTTPPPTPIVWTPSPVVDTVSTPQAGTLVDTTPPAAAPGVQVPQVASVLTSIFNGVKNIFGSTAATVRPGGTGTVVGTVPATASWFSQSTVMPGLPNWGLLAGVGVGGLLLASAMGSGGGGSRRRRNPARRNPAELILMGANPYRSPVRRRRAR